MIDVPEFSSQSLKKLQKLEKIPTWNEKADGFNAKKSEQKRVILIQDAFTSFYESGLIIEFYHLLKKLGLHVFLAPFHENGKPLHVKGFLNQFRKVAEKQASWLDKIASSGIPLVGIEPSVVLTYRDEYPEILMNDDLNFNVMLPQEFLLEQLHLLQSHRPRESETFSMLGHCTEKTGASASQTQWLEIFQALGQELNLIEVGCCGMAGTYGHETEHFEESKGIYKMSWQKHCRGDSNLGNQLLVSGFSCRSQIERFENFRHLHPIQALNQMI